MKPLPHHIDRASDLIVWPDNDYRIFDDEDELREYLDDNASGFPDGELFYGKPRYWEPWTADYLGEVLLDSTWSLDKDGAIQWHPPSVHGYGWIDESFIEDMYQFCDWDYPTDVHGLDDLQTAIEVWLVWNTPLYRLLGYRLTHPRRLFVGNWYLQQAIYQFGIANQRKHWFVEADKSKPFKFEE